MDMRIFNFNKSLRTMAFATLLAGSCITASAEDLSYVTLVFHDGHKQSYVLSQDPKISFGDGTLSITSADVDDTWQLADVQHFVFDKHDATAVVALQKDECRLTFDGRDMVTLEGYQAGADIVVTDAAGRNVAKAVVDAAGEARLSLAGLGKGVYVVAVKGARAYKLMRR